MIDVNKLSAIVRNASPTLTHNKALFSIFEGQLKEFLLQELKASMSANSYEQIKTRLAPINVLKRIVDKLSRIYNEPPVRRVIGGNDKDAALLDWFVAIMRANRRMASGNEFFNLFKNALIQPAINTNTGKPVLRAIPSDRFIVWSDDQIEPTNPTGVITLEGKARDTKSHGTAQVYAAYTADEWLMFDSNGDERRDLMGESADGVNPFGVLPFVYINRSDNLVMPLPDSDTLTMTKVIPIILSDLNYAAMYQCFSIIYGVDVDDSNITMAPNSFWTFRSLGDGERKPEIGVVKPQVDIDKVLGLIQSQLAFWLQTRGIRPGAVGQLTQDNAASGISKIVDEMDTTDDRKKQVNHFADAEKQLWDLILKTMHPVWAQRGLVEQRYLFTPTAMVEVIFPEQIPLVDRSTMVTTLRDEVAAGFTTRRRAIAKLNPSLDDNGVDELMQEIEKEVSHGWLDRRAGQGENEAGMEEDIEDDKE
jgi:hypothetical protein